MANTIKLKRASGSDPGNSDLSVGELAIRTSNCKLFSKNDGGSAVGIVAGSADTLTTARTIAGVSFDGSANISLNNNAITNGAGYITATLTQEQVEDYVGGMVTGNTETGITVTYDDSDGTLDFVVASQTENDFTTTLKNKLDGIAASAIANVVEDTSPQLGGDLDVQSSKITTATSNGNVKIEPDGTGVVEVRGAGGNDGKLQLNCSAQSHGIILASPAHSAGQSYTLIFPDNQIAADKYLKIKSISGSGSTAIGQAEYASLDANDLGEGTVPDARFPSTLPALNGSALTDLNGSNIASGTIAAARVATLNQDTTGNAATATALETARTIAGVSFDGSANISLNNNAITNGAGYLADIVSDTSPQLGGNLDVNAKNIVFGDSSGTGDDRLTFGAATNGDLRIYHDGLQSYIYDAGTGDLNLQTNGTKIKLGKDDGASCGVFIPDAGVELYHNNSKKFETTSSGGTLTGTLTATGLTLSGSVGAAITAASDGSTITLDLGANTHQSVTLGGNRTFAAPSNQTVGQSGSIFITQDGTGSRTASFNSAFKFVGGTAPTLSTAASAVDRIDYVIKSSNVIHCAISLDVK